MNPIQSPQKKTSDLHAEREREQLFFSLVRRVAAIVSLAEVLLYVLIYVYIHNIYINIGTKPKRVRCYQQISATEESEFQDEPMKYD